MCCAQLLQKPLVAQRAFLGAVLRCARRLRWSAVDRAQRPDAAGAVEALGEQVADVVHEQRPRPRLAFVVGDVPAQHQLLLRARDGRVQQVALGRQRILGLAEPQPRDLREPPPLVLGEERLRLGARREHALLQPADEQRPHSARTQRQRVEHGHGIGALRRSARAVEELERLQRARELARRRGRELRGDPRELAQLAERPAPAGERLASPSSSAASRLAPARRGAQNSQ